MNVPLPHYCSDDNLWHKSSLPFSNGWSISQSNWYFHWLVTLHGQNTKARRFWSFHKSARGNTRLCHAM